MASNRTEPNIQWTADMKTDASGNFGGTMTVPSSGVPFTQATVKLTAVYSGNAQYAVSQSAPVTITAHFS